MKMLRLVYAETVERSGANISDAREITIIFALQGMKRPLRLFFRAFFQYKIDVLCLRRPDPEMRLIWTD